MLTRIFMIPFLTIFALSCSTGDDTGESVPKGAPVAVVEEVNPKVMSGGREIAIEQKIPLDATIESDKSGYALMRLPDKSSITLAPESRISLAEFNDMGGEESVILEIGKGAARYITGEIARRNRMATIIKTPQASIGIRGTALGVHAGDDETLIFLEHTSGAGVSVINSATGAKTDLAEPGKIVDVSKTETVKRDPTLLELNFFNALSKNPGSASPDLLWNYAGVWKSEIPMRFQMISNRGRGARVTDTIDENCVISFTVEEGCKNIDLKDYGNDEAIPGLPDASGKTRSIPLPVKSMLSEQGDLNGLEFPISNICIPTISDGKVVTTTLPRGIMTIAPRGKIGHLRTSDGNLLFELIFRVISQEEFEVLQLVDNIAENVNQNGDIILKMHGTNQNRDDTAIFTRISRWERLNRI